MPHPPGLFAEGTYGDGWDNVSGAVNGLFYGGGLGQFWAELIGVTTCFIALSVLSLIVHSRAACLRKPEPIL